MINYILENNAMALNNEDKRLGVYFVGENHLSEPEGDIQSEQLKRKFANKVLMYL